MTFFVSSGTFYTFAVGSSADASGQRAGSFSEDRPLGWDPIAKGNRAGDGMARLVSEEKATGTLVLRPLQRFYRIKQFFCDFHSILAAKHHPHAVCHGGTQLCGLLLQQGGIHSA